MSPERIDPLEENHGLEGEAHLNRYRFACQFVRGADVLDVACGTGYGSHMLAKHGAKSVMGIDISAEAIDIATRKYMLQNVAFYVGNATSLPTADAAFDVVISFETIEHLVDHQAYLNELKRTLRPGGTVVISTPDKAVYNALNGNIPNPYHVHELSDYEFYSLMETNFTDCKFYGQRQFKPCAFRIGKIIAAADPLRMIGRSLLVIRKAGGRLTQQAIPTSESEDTWPVPIVNGQRYKYLICIARHGR